MSITIELFEASGPVAYSGGSTNEPIANVNWKAAVGQAPDYFQYPVRYGSTGLGLSYPKYIYAKISGTFTNIKRIRWRLKYLPSLDNTIVLLCAQTNVYTPPTTGWINGAPWTNNGLDKPCRLSTNSPQNAVNVPFPLAANTTYYTDYLVTQLVTRIPGDPSAQLALGNTIPLEISLVVDEYE